MKIMTVTLSPAFDIHARILSLALGCENIASVTGRDIGGKGVNISRALTANGIDSTALVVLGSESSESFRRSLELEGIHHIAIERPGTVRENLTLHCDDGTETRISFHAAPLDASVLTELCGAISADADTAVTFTGSVPPGIPMDALVQLIERLRADGARIVIDSRSFTLAQLIQISPWLIKPNSEEIAAYCKKAPKSTEEYIAFAEHLCSEGIENVMLSLGGDGAILATAGGTYIATPPPIEVASTIGAGDSSIAGFIAASARGEEPMDALRLAVAYGTAACTLEGTAPPQPADIDRIYSGVRVRSADVH